MRPSAGQQKERQKDLNDKPAEEAEVMSSYMTKNLMSANQSSF